MRVFVGTVNGKSFDNENDFNKAAVDALKSNDGQMVISSYYTYKEDPKPVEKKKTGENLSEDKWKIGELDIPVCGDGEIYYKLGDDKKELLKSAGNRVEIIGRALAYAKDCGENAKKSKENISELNRKLDGYMIEIEKIRDKIFDAEVGESDYVAKENYYREIARFLEDKKKPEHDGNDSECCGKKCSKCTKGEKTLKDYDNLIDFLNNIKFF